ncbi:hypothetical protein BKI51_04135 [Alphaproteobacteria bacterium AO1-B]|nr:hypothetical protein BKI51_04135 [Alphaproteobacteria bacterium AO1-B]
MTGQRSRLKTGTAASLKKQEFALCPLGRPCAGRGPAITAASVEQNRKAPEYWIPAYAGMAKLVNSGL